MRPSNTRDRSITQLANMSFDEIFDVTAGVYFYFVYICEDTQPVIRAIGVSRRHFAKMSFGKIFDLTARSVL